MEGAMLRVVNCPMRRQVMQAASSVSRTCKRFTHRTPDFFWVENGVKDLGYCRVAPELMSRYMRAASACRQKGKHPFVHAQTAVFRFPRVFVEEVSGVKTRFTDFFRYLRDPAPQFAVEASAVKKRVDDFVEKRHVGPDEDPDLRSHMLSMSYALVQPGVCESAGYFLFNNRSMTRAKEIGKIVESSVVAVLKSRGKEHRAPEVMSAFWKMKKEYASLNWGTAYLIAVPDSLLREVVYDSKAFGIPTGEPIERMVKRSHESPRAFTCEQGGAQARLLMCSATMNPRSGIDVVDVSNPSEVESYCQGQEIVPVHEVPQLHSLFKGACGETEKAEMENRKKLDEAVRDLARFALA